MIKFFAILLTTSELTLFPSAIYPPFKWFGCTLKFCDCNCSCSKIDNLLLIVFKYIFCVLTVVRVGTHLFLDILTPEGLN